MYEFTKSGYSFKTEGQRILEEEVRNIGVKKEKPPVESEYSIKNLDKYLKAEE